MANSEIDIEERNRAQEDIDAEYDAQSAKYEAEEMPCDNCKTNMPYIINDKYKGNVSIGKSLLFCNYACMEEYREEEMLKRPPNPDRLANEVK